jgi:hypothetical protein
MKKIIDFYQTKETYLDKVTRMIESRARDLVSKIDAQSLSQEEKDLLKIIREDLEKFLLQKRYDALDVLFISIMSISIFTDGLFSLHFLFTALICAPLIALKDYKK